MRVYCLMLTALFLVGCGKSSHKACAPGEAGCACVAQACNGGLLCTGNVCTSEQRAGLSVDSAARGCEVLIADSATAGKVDSVQFGPDVTGRWLRQGDKVAAAFVANKDSPIGSSAVQVAYAGASGAFSILNSHCYGSRGEELAGSTVHQ